ncbi:MAG TPA: ABC transporter ATP-binding protein [Anaeromyxobacteraceae bacterium]|nr:ABC transporter ATP-binding protein [Anaeromyxobacteraceae bacterium]
MIALRSIRKRFRDAERDLLVLDGLDLEVSPGELVAVVGPSGSGKSTLLYVVGGLDGDFEGQAVVAGQDISRLGAAERAAFRNQAVGFVFQSFNLLPALPAAENVMLPGLFARAGTARPLRALREAALSALERVGLADKAHKLPARLSGGERQRVAIARAILARPRVLLADEPTGNLDAATGASIIALFQELARGGMTVLVVTHEERVSAVAGRVLHLEAGRLR